MPEDEVHFMPSTPVYPPTSSAASSVSSREPRQQSTKSGERRTKIRIPKSKPAGSFGIHDCSTKVIQTPAILIDRNSQR